MKSLKKLLLMMCVLFTACSYPDGYTPHPYIPSPPSESGAAESSQGDPSSPDAFIDHTQPIALLLPLTGHLSINANSIRDGFFSAHHADPTYSEQSLNITVYDTQNDQNTAKVYQQAVKDGAQLVIGPLTKAGVSQIKSLKKLPVPIITLNYSGEDAKETEHLFEFGLAPEDEAREAARIAYRQGKHRALLLLQADEWGGRVGQAFSDEWHKLGGTIATKLAFNPQDKMDTVVRQALHIHLTDAQKEDHNYRPPYRQDIDMIFLAAYPDTARQIKPLLNFYYANNLPVYGTSSLYTLPPQVTLDKDLNGVIFCDMPWVLDPANTEPQLHATINELWPSTASAYARFYALGIDAYKLATQVQNLKSGYIYQISGVTGTLQFAKNGRIEREVVCAQFKNGRPFYTVRTS